MHHSGAWFDIQMINPIPFMSTNGLKLPDRHLEFEFSGCPILKKETAQSRDFDYCNFHCAQMIIFCLTWEHFTVNSYQSYIDCMTLKTEGNDP